jgi:hypothetical protein
LQAAVGGGPVLPICGILFLLAAVGPFGQARRDSEQLEVMDSMPGQWGADLVDDFRRHERTERTYGVLWLVVGGALLGTPLFLKPRVWQLGWRMNGVGCSWLDAPSNRKGNPNENLARELMELFTLGIGHYTEADVKEAARALTGWTVVGGALLASFRSLFWAAGRPVEQCHWRKTYRTKKRIVNIRGDKAEPI